MSEHRALEDLLYVGPLGVALELDYRAGTATASTMDVTAPIFGAEIHFTIFDDNDPEYFGSVDMWYDLLQQMRNTLARLMVLGEILPAPSRRLMDAQAHENAERAISLLGEDFFTITLEAARAALAQRITDAEEVEAYREKWLARWADENIPTDPPFRTGEE